MPSLSNSPWILVAPHSGFSKLILPDEIAHLFTDPWPAAGRTALPSPVRGKTHSMPTHDGLGPDDGNGVKDARTATIEPNEQGTVGPPQMQPTGHALLQDIELMPQNQDFGFKPLS
jgi:hypothetical protein